MWIENPTRAQQEENDLAYDIITDNVLVENYVFEFYENELVDFRWFLCIDRNALLRAICLSRLLFVPMAIFSHSINSFFYFLVWEWWVVLGLSWAKREHWGRLLNNGVWTGYCTRDPSCFLFSLHLSWLATHEEAPLSLSLSQCTVFALASSSCLIMAC